MAWTVATRKMKEERDDAGRVVWQKLVDETGEALIEEAAAVSLAQAEQELAAAGVDVAEGSGQADAFLASLAAGASLETDD